jgi:hypothetical protein
VKPCCIHRHIPARNRGNLIYLASHLQAYHRWLCASVFRKCNLGADNTTATLPTCESNFTRTNSKALPDCVMRTCQDVCYDVVRKCPVHLEFRCPPVIDLREYVSSTGMRLSSLLNLPHALPQFFHVFPPRRFLSISSLRCTFFLHRAERVVCARVWIAPIVE